MGLPALVKVAHDLRPASNLAQLVRALRGVGVNDGTACGISPLRVRARRGAAQIRLPLDCLRLCELSARGSGALALGPGDWLRLRAADRGLGGRSLRLPRSSPPQRQDA